MAGRYRGREVVSALLRRLHLHGVQGWWDAGTDIKAITWNRETRRSQERAERRSKG